MGRRLVSPELADKIRQAREVEGLTYAQLKSRFGISKSTVYLILCGQWEKTIKPRRSKSNAPSQVKRLSNDKEVCECGRYVYKPKDGWPCIACRAEKFIEIRKACEFILREGPIPCET